MPASLPTLCLSTHPGAGVHLGRGERASMFSGEETGDARTEDRRSNVAKPDPPAGDPRESTFAPRSMFHVEPRAQPMGTQD